MNKYWARKSAKNKMNSLQRSTRNKILENRQINVKFCNKKSSDEKTQAECECKRDRKIKRVYPVELHEPLNNKTDSYKFDFKKFRPSNLRTFENRFNQSVYKTETLFWLTFLALCGKKCML